MTSQPPTQRPGTELDWITGTLDGLGTAVTGPVEVVREVPWSRTVRAPTTAGVRWFKANAAGCAYEAPLAAALGEWVPEQVLVPLAVDAGRGWLLSADQGPTLRETVTGADRVAAWERMLRAYAKLQRDLIPRAGALLALGVPDVRVRSLPAHLAALLADDGVRAGLGDRVAAVEAVVPAFDEWCAELAADGLPASLQHDDLHDNNVFPSMRFFDWGDASVAHPFGTLLVTLNSFAYAGDIAPGAPELLRLRDAYLEVWTDLAPPAALRRSASLACRVTRVSRALSWQRSLRDATPPLSPDYADAVADWLAETPEPAVV